MQFQQHTGVAYFLFKLALYFSIFALPVIGQIEVLNFEPPFRLKYLHQFGDNGRSGEIWAVGGEGSVSVRSHGKGKLLTISDNDLNSIFFIDRKVAVVVGNAGEILTTQDHGATWSKMASGTEIDLTSVYCVDLDSCWIVGARDGILLRGSPNSNWKLSRIVSQGELLDVYFVDRMNGYVVGWNGLFLKTVDGGNRWERSSIPLTIEVGEFIGGVPIFESVVFKDRNTGCIAGWVVGTGVVSCTDDGGTSWRTSKVEITPKGIVWGRNNEIYLVDMYGRNLVSKDLGVSWRPHNKCPTRKMDYDAKRK